MFIFPICTPVLGPGFIFPICIPVLGPGFIFPICIPVLGLVLIEQTDSINYKSESQVSNLKHLSSVWIEKKKRRVKF